MSATCPRIVLAANFQQASIQICLYRRVRFRLARRQYGRLAQAPLELGDCCLQLVVKTAERQYAPCTENLEKTQHSDFMLQCLLQALNSMLSDVSPELGERIEHSSVFFDSNFRQWGCATCKSSGLRVCRPSSVSSNHGIILYGLVPRRGGAPQTRSRTTKTA